MSCLHVYKLHRDGSSSMNSRHPPHQSFAQKFLWNYLHQLLVVRLDLWMHYVTRHFVRDIYPPSRNTYLLIGGLLPPPVKSPIGQPSWMALLNQTVHQPGKEAQKPHSEYRREIS